MIAWSSYPGPEAYKPDEVSPALSACEAVTSRASALKTYHRVLFAVGNNHAGTVYPAAAAAAPILLRLALESDGWLQWLGFEVLVELVLFEAEPGYEEFVNAEGVRVRVKDNIRETIWAARAGLRCPNRVRMPSSIEYGANSCWN